MKPLRIAGLLILAILLLGTPPTRSASQPQQLTTTTTTVSSQPMEDSVSPRSEASTDVQSPDVVQSSAVATEYTFSSASGTYTEFTGGLSCGGGTFAMGVNIGFPFHYNGGTYTSLTINSNGFVTIGDGNVTLSACNYKPLSHPDGRCDNAVAPLGMALEGNPASIVRRGMIGTAPNRIFIVQWKDYRTAGAAANAESFNFQIRLHETTDLIEFVYGSFSKDSTDRNAQVGIRGSALTDFNSRTTTTDWANSIASMSSQGTMLLSTIVSPTVGLTFAWTPVAILDLSSSYKTAPAFTPPGAPLTYTVHIANTGHATATTASLLDSVPANVTYNPGSVACSSGACSYDGGVNAVRWNGSVAPFTTALVTFTVNTDGLSWADTITNTATLSDTSLYTSMVVSAVSVYGYATRPVVLSPNPLNFAGCNDGTCQTRAITLLNNTNITDTFDLSYTLDEPLFGTVTGPSTATLLNGEAISLSVTLTTPLCLPDNIDITGKIQAVARSTPYSDTATFNKLITTTPSWTSVPDSKPGWGGSGYPGDGCTAKNAAGQWVTYIMGDAYSGSSLSGFVGYNHATNTWSQMNAINQPAERWQPDWAYDADTNLCYLTGGSNTPNPGVGTYNEAYRYDPVTNAFTPLGNFTTVRNFHDSWVGLVNGIQMLCVGGGINTSGALASTQCYDLSQTAPGVWATENATLGPFPATTWGAADGVLHATTGDQFWSVAGVVSDTVTPNIRYWDDADSTWHTVAAGGWVRYRVEGDFVNGDFYIVGGSLDGSSLIPLAAASRYHFDGQHWVWTDLGYMTNSRADNVANAGGNALWSVDGYGGNSTGYVERLDVCPACTERGKIMGHVYDYDGVNPPITSYQLKLMPGNVTIPLDASGAYTKELVPWPYRLTASANGYPASVTATLQVQNGITLSHDFVLARPDVVVNPTTLSDVLYVADTPVSATHIVVLTNVGTLPLNFKIQEVKPEEQTYAIQAIKSISSSVAPLVVEPALAKQMTEQGQGSYLIDLRERADLSPAYGMNWHDRGWFVLKALQAVAERSQAKVRAYLDTQGVKYQSLWIDNLIAVENSNKAAFVGLQTFPEIAALRTVPTVVLDQPQPVSPLLQAPTSIEPNLTHIKADQVWAQGITGTGIIVANIDTGVRYTHQALVRQYRGNLGGGVFDHSYNWYDPVDHSTTPNDADTGSPSHGSHTMGTLVGDDGAGNQVGVAPGAQWIACQAFKPRGTFLSAIECGQFLAAPTDIAGNNPNPDMRPHIINNSWAECNTPGVYFPWYDGVLDTWHAAGIYPVFGMGNTDANCLMSGLGTVLSPAASARVTAVGALGRADGTLAGYSLWGPTDQIDTWNPLGYPSLKPQLSAPGTNRSVNGRYNDTGYADGSGTSMATPHVAGVIALMWSAAPCMIGNYTDTETILMQTALTTTTPGYPGSAWDGPNGKPNQATGWGEVNAKAAVDAAMDFCTYNWNPWVSETPAQGTLAPVGNLPIEVALTCTYSDTLKPQPLQSQLVLKDNDPADHAVALSLECLTSPLRLSQYTTATSGEVISQALVITSAGNFSSTAVLTDALPSGLSYVGNLTATAGVAWDSANIIHWMYTGTATTTMPAVVTITFAAQTAGDYSWNGSQGTAWDNANNWTSSVLHNTVWLGWEETNGLVLHLPLDEAAGATTFADVSGNNNQGGCTLASCPTAGVIGKQGQTVQFDGTDDVITVADAPSLRNSAFTLSAWFQWDGMGTSAVNFLTAKGLENMELQTGGGAGVNGLRFIPAGYPKTNVDATNVITTGWNHVAATYDGNTATLYVNGVSVGSRTGITNANNLITDAYPLYIGRRSDGTFPFDGVIDDVRVYRRVLSASEIANLAKLREGHIRSTRDVTLTGWPGLHANATLPAGAATYPVLNVNTGVNNLIIQSGGALTIPVGITLTVESGLVNSGTLSIQRNVSGPSATNFHLYNSSLAPTYYGVQVTPSTTLGPTWVEIHGNTQCTTALLLDTVNRCVRITPQITNTSALVRMYYRTDELAGHDPATLQLWQRSNSSWLPLGSMRGSVSDGGYVEGVATPCEAATEFALTEPLPQLSLSKSVTPMINVPYHGVVTYTILFSNTETISDTHARLTDTLPANITFGQWVAQPSGVVRTGNVVTWTGTLTNNTVLTFIFTATHTGSYGDIVTNTAWLNGTIQTGSASAVFSVNPSYTLTVGLSGNGSGVVTSLPAGITCGAQCAATYEAGQLITLTATPLPNSTFIVWSGAGVTTTNPLTLLINATRQVTATFALNTYIITPTAGVGGSLTPSTPQTVNYGDSITFTITADNGYQIDDVSVDGISHGALDSYTFTNVTANHALSATFALKNTCEPISDVGFSFSPLRPLIGEPVQFTGTVVAGTAPLTYTWDWGDGTAAGLGAVLSHAFPLTATVRAYTVTLAVNNQCSGPLTAEQAVAIMPQQVFLPLALRDQ